MAIAIAKTTFAERLRCEHHTIHYVPLEAPVSTVVDLWYARHGEKVIHRSSMALVRPDILEDWLDRNMIGVLQRVLETVVFDCMRYQHLHHAGAMEIVIAPNEGSFQSTDGVDFVVRPARLRHTTPSITLEYAPWK